jgi:two-component system, NtrC family, sensor kinase
MEDMSSPADARLVVVLARAGDQAPPGRDCASAVERAGFEVAEVHGLDGALARLQGSRGVFLVDARGGGQGALEPCAQLAARAPGSAVVALLDEPSSSLAALDAGASDYALGLAELPARLAVAWRLVDERARHHAALLAEAARGRAFLMAIPDIVFRISRDGVYLEVHAGRVEELIAPPETAIGRRISELIPPPLGDMLTAAVHRVATTGQPEQMEYSLPISADAAHFEARLVPGVEGDVVAFVRNVTERRLLEAQVRAADRLGSMGALAAGVTHEMNNPLTYVLLNLSSVGRVLESARLGTASELALSNASRSVREALEGVERMRLIVQDLRTITRTDEQPRTVLEASVVLAAAVRIAAATSPGVRFDMAVGALPPMLGDEARMGQLFLNLLTNAAHATAGLGPERSVVTLRARTSGGALVVEVEDTGHGIAPEHLGHIFEPFFTTKSASVGTGLGLWMCQRAIRGMGGTIRVASRLGEGSVFTVSIPLSPGASFVEQRPA